MLVNEYRLEIQFKKVWKVRNITVITFQWSNPDHCMECRLAQNGLYMVRQHRDMATYFFIISFGRTFKIICKFPLPILRIIS